MIVKFQCPVERHPVVRNHRSSEQLHIIWVYSGSLAADLDAATWLETVKELRDCRFWLRVSSASQMWLVPENMHLGLSKRT
jgi:hypothetical protein